VIRDRLIDRGDGPKANEIRRNKAA
jgi:hypothetical protein